MSIGSSNGKEVTEATFSENPSLWLGRLMKALTTTFANAYRCSSTRSTSASLSEGNSKSSRLLATLMCRASESGPLTPQHVSAVRLGPCQGRADI
jgi:hypothetical protein